MTDESVGGKARRQRNHNSSKPYDRRKSILSRVGETVKEFLTPSFLRVFNSPSQESLVSHDSDDALHPHVSQHQHYSPIPYPDTSTPRPPPNLTLLQSSDESPRSAYTQLHPVNRLRTTNHLPLNIDYSTIDLTAQPEYSTIDLTAQPDHTQSTTLPFTAHPSPSTSTLPFSVHQPVESTTNTQSQQRQAYTQPLGQTTQTYPHVPQPLTQPTRQTTSQPTDTPRLFRHIDTSKPPPYQQPVDIFRQTSPYQMPSDNLRQSYLNQSQSFAYQPNQPPRQPLTHTDRTTQRPEITETNTFGNVSRTNVDMNATHDDSGGSSKENSMVSQSNLWSEQSKVPQPKKPAFNASLFGPTPSDDVTQQLHSSPYYPGRTSYGGFSNQRPSRFNNSPYQVMPKRQKITAQSSGSSSTSSSTAKRILETLQNMSTPLSDAKRIPVDRSADSLLSFTATSYQRRRQSLGITNSRRQSLTHIPRPPVDNLNITSPASITVNRQQAYIPQEAVPEEINASAYPSQEAVAGRGASSGKIRRERSQHHAAASRVPDIDDAPFEPPNLRTDFTLPISQLPAFSFTTSTPNIPVSKPNTFPTAPMSSHQNYHNQLQSSCQQQQGQPDNPPLSYTFSTPTMKVSYQQSSPSSLPNMRYTFSEPLPHTTSDPSSINHTQSVNVHSGSSSSHPSTSNQTNQPSTDNHISQLQLLTSNQTNTEHLTNSQTHNEQLSQNQNRESFKSIKFTSNITSAIPKRTSSNTNTTQSTLQSGIVLDILGGQSATLRTGSVMDILGGGVTVTTTPDQLNTSTQNMSPISESIPLSTGLSAFLKPSGSWECSVCMVRNDSKHNKCVACQVSKPQPDAVTPPRVTPPRTSSPVMSDVFAKFKKSASNWECDTCMVSNTENTRCVSCQTPKPGSKTESTPATATTTEVPDVPLSNVFAKFVKSAGWTCDVCCVSNGADAVTCAACETPKPGAAKPKAATSGGPKFAFDTSAPTNSGFSFMNAPQTNGPVTSADTTPLTGGFKISTNNNEPVGGFKFGGASDATPGGFKFGGASIDTTTPPTGGFKFGGDVTETKQNNSTGGFKFGDTTNSDVSRNTPTSEAGTNNTGGFTFGNTLTAQPTQNSDAGGFTFGNTSVVTTTATATTIGGFTFNSGNTNTTTSSSAGFTLGSSIQSSTQPIQSTLIQSTTPTSQTPATTTTPNTGFTFTSNTSTSNTSNNNINQIGITSVQYSQSQPTAPSSVPSGFQFGITPISAPQATTSQAFTFGATTTATPTQLTPTPGAAFSFGAATSAPSVQSSPFTFGTTNGPVASIPSFTPVAFPAESTPATTPFAFGANNAFGSNGVTNGPTAPPSFGASQSMPPAASTPFAFGGGMKRSNTDAGAPPEKKLSITFGVAVSTSASPAFGSSNVQSNPAFGQGFPPPPLFGQTEPTPFSGFNTQVASGGFNFGAASTPSNGEVFKFGAAPAPQINSIPIPTFDAQPAAQPAAPAAGGFNFSANVPPSFTFGAGNAPTQPASSVPFTFNSSADGGANPFNASPSPVNPQRKIRKAIRKTRK